MTLKSLKVLLVSSLSLTWALGQEITPAEESIPPDSAEIAPAAQDNPLARFDWQTSGSGEVGDHATIEIPEGYVFLNGAETAEVMALFGNLPAVYEGMIGPESLDWFVVFEFEDAGYVKDDEKDELDSEDLLEMLQEGEEVSNEERRKRGMSPLNTVGWAVEPNYNEATNNLEWGVILENAEGEQNVNFLTKLLGRHGIMHTTLVCDTDQLEAILPEYQELLTGFDYNSGQTYADYEEGDKVAEYGLKALVAGGAVFAAAKLGLFGTIALWFKKAFKLIIAGVLAVGVFLKRLISGKKADA